MFGYGSDVEKWYKFNIIFERMCMKDIFCDVILMF